MRCSALLGVVLVLTLAACSDDGRVLAPVKPQLSKGGPAWASAAWIGHAHNRIVNRIAAAVSAEAYARHGRHAILRAAARACRPAMAAEHVDQTMCDQLEPEHFVPPPASAVARAWVGGVHAELSDFGLWTAYAQQVQSAVASYDDPSAQLDQIAYNASMDWSLTDEERAAVYNLCSFGASSASYWSSYIPSINGGKPVPGLGRALVGYDVAGAIIALRTAKSPWALLGGAALGSVAGLVNKIIEGEVQIQTPVYDLCQYHPGAC